MSREDHFKYVNLIMARARRFKDIYDLDSEMYRPPYLNIYHKPSCEEDIENKSIRYLKWSNCSVKPFEGLFILKMFE